MTIRIGQDFEFSIERAELLSFGAATINGSDVDTIRWYNQHGTVCSFHARDDLANLIIEEIGINQQPPLVLYTNPRVGIILQVIHRNMTSNDVDFIIEYVPFVEPARIGTLVNAQLDFYEVTGELGLVMDKHGTHLSSEMLCPNGLIVRQIIYVDDESLHSQLNSPCHSLIVIGCLQFPVPANFVQKGRQLVEIRTVPMSKLPWKVTCSENVVKYTLENAHQWIEQTPNTTAFVVEYRVEDETLLIEFHEVAISGITTAAQILDAHKLMQPDDGWTLFTDKHGQELLPGCLIEVGDIIGIIDNISPNEVPKEPISPTLPYCVIDEHQGSRPVTDRTHESFLKIAMQVEAYLYTSTDIPTCLMTDHCAARIWQTVNHGPPIARDEMLFYINCLAEETGCFSLGVKTCKELFSEQSINAIASGKGQQLMAVLVAQHWRILSVHNKELHWFYSCDGLELQHQITTMVNQLLPPRYESHTHLGSGVNGWCGWDALEAWIEFRNVKITPDNEPINPPLHQQVPAQWMVYHDTMTGHPLLSAQELALILRTRWFKRILSCPHDFIVVENPLGLGRDDTNMKGIFEKKKGQ